MEILKLFNICQFLCNTCEYLHFYRKFAEMDKEKRKPKRQPEFTSSTDNKSYKNIFLM